jgi:hypothetical protein
MSKKLDEEKQQTLEQLLQEEYALVHLDSTRKGVTLPDKIMNLASVTLKLSRLFRGGIELFNDRVETKLLFGKDYHPCIIPFSCIWGLTSIKGSNIIWPDSAPKEVLLQLTKQALVDKPKKSEKPALKAVKSVERPTVKPAAIKSEKAKKGAAKRGAPYLKRVK